MTDNNLKPAPEPALSAGEPDTAEAKRRAARRGFLKGSAVGAGAIIVTFYHQRAAAGKKIMTSSAAVCSSLHGNVVGTKEVKDVTNPGGPKITVTECELPHK